MEDSLSRREGNGESSKQDKGTESEVGQGRVPGQRDRAEGLKGQRHGRKAHSWRRAGVGGLVRSHRGLRRRKTPGLGVVLTIAWLSSVTVGTSLVVQW